MRLLRVAGGAFLGCVVLALLWAAGILEPPEGISRRIAAFSAVYPGPVGSAVVERIPCPPLRRLRLYVVCTGGCEDVWRIVAVRGLSAENLENLGRLPLEPPEEVRRRANALIAREHLRLGPGGAREMVGCYMRLDGLLPQLVLRDEDVAAVERSRGEGEEAMANLARSLDEPDALSRITVGQATDGSFAARFFYWDTSQPGRPVLDLDWRLTPDGRIESFEAHALPLRDGTASGNTPGTPPT